MALPTSSQWDRLDYVLTITYNNFHIKNLFWIRNKITRHAEFRCRSITFYIHPPTRRILNPLIDLSTTWSPPLCCCPRVLLQPTDPIHHPTAQFLTQSFSHPSIQHNFKPQKWCTVAWITILDQKQYDSIFLPTTKNLLKLVQFQSMHVCNLPSFLSLRHLLRHKTSLRNHDSPQKFNHRKDYFRNRGFEVGTIPKHIRPI